MTDIAARLRTRAVGGNIFYATDAEIMREAADEIELLRNTMKLHAGDVKDAMQEIDRLRAALEEYGDHKYECTMKDTWQCSCGYTAVLRHKP